MRTRDGEVPPSPGREGESDAHPPPTPPPDAEGFRAPDEKEPDRDRARERFPLEPGPQFEQEC